MIMSVCRVLSVRIQGVGAQAPSGAKLALHHMHDSAKGDNRQAILPSCHPAPKIARTVYKKRISTQAWARPAIPFSRILCTISLSLALVSCSHGLLQTLLHGGIRSEVFPKTIATILLQLKEQNSHAPDVRTRNCQPLVDHPRDLFSKIALLFVHAPGSPQVKHQLAEEV